MTAVSLVAVALHLLSLELQCGRCTAGPQHSSCWATLFGSLLKFLNATAEVIEHAPPI